ncbi:hypothetical protein TNCV_2090031 [Trichonephila clavipes]|nr:hypothetical protein TNCV_2090031 [Trichonephila clavipes]
MRGHGSLVVKVSDRGCRVMSSSRVPLKTRRPLSKLHAHLAFKYPTDQFRFKRISDPGRRRSTGRLGIGGF